MLAIIKFINYDFNHEITVCAVTDNEETAKIILQNEIENEKEIQEKCCIHYDTVEETETSYEAYNMGYKSDVGVHICIADTHYYDKIEKNS